MPSAIVLSLYVAGSMTHIVPFLRQGTGGYAAAVGHMAAGTAGPVIAVGSGHDFRNGAVLLYYRRILEDGKSLRYFASSQLPPRGVDWYITHSKLDEPEFGDTLRLGRHVYVLDAKFRYYGPSGFNWWVYRRRQG